MNISVVIPCLNEEQTIAVCVKKALKVIEKEKMSGEVIVVDNGSSDESVMRSQRAGAKVVLENMKGYGRAIRRGIRESGGQIIIMGDGDNTYDFSTLQRFVHSIQNGADLVIGNRYAGKIYKKAMPFLHRWVGTPILTRMLCLFFGTKVSDINCGMRAFKKSIFEQFDLKCDGMELASEMIIKAAINRLNICEIPVDLFPPKPGRKAHLNTFKDGFQHLKIIMAYSPINIFSYLRVTFSLLVLGFLYMF